MNPLRGKSNLTPLELLKHEAIEVLTNLGATGRATDVKTATTFQQLLGVMTQSEHQVKLDLLKGKKTEKVTPESWQNLLKISAKVESYIHRDTYVSSDQEPHGETKVGSAYESSLPEFQAQADPLLSKGEASEAAASSPSSQKKAEAPASRPPPQQRSEEISLDDTHQDIIKLRVIAAAIGKGGNTITLKKMEESITKLTNLKVKLRQFQRQESTLSKSGTEKEKATAAKKVKTQVLDQRKEIERLLGIFKSRQLKQLEESRGGSKGLSMSRSRGASIFGPRKESMSRSRGASIFGSRRASLSKDPHIKPKMIQEQVEKTKASADQEGLENLKKLYEMVQVRTEYIVSKTVAQGDKLREIAKITADFKPQLELYGRLQDLQEIPSKPLLKQLLRDLVLQKQSADLKQIEILNAMKVETEDLLIQNISKEASSPSSVQTYLNDLGKLHIKNQEIGALEKLQSKDPDNTSNNQKLASAKFIKDAIKADIEKNSSSLFSVASMQDFITEKLEIYPALSGSLTKLNKAKNLKSFSLSLRELQTKMVAIRMENPELLDDDFGVILHEIAEISSLAKAKLPSQKGAEAASESQVSAIDEGREELESASQEIPNMPSTKQVVTLKAQIEAAKVETSKVKKREALGKMIRIAHQELSNINPKQKKAMERVSILENTLVSLKEGAQVEDADSDDYYGMVFAEQDEDLFNIDALGLDENKNADEKVIAKLKYLEARLKNKSAQIQLQINLAELKAIPDGIGLNLEGIGKAGELLDDAEKQLTTMERFYRKNYLVSSKEGEFTKRIQGIPGNRATILLQNRANLVAARKKIEEVQKHEITKITPEKKRQLRNLTSNFTALNTRAQKLQSESDTQKLQSESDTQKVDKLLEQQGNDLDALQLSIVDTEPSKIAFQEVSNQLYAKSMELGKSRATNFQEASKAQHTKLIKKSEQLKKNTKSLEVVESKISKLHDEKTKILIDNQKLNKKQKGNPTDQKITAKLASLEKKDKKIDDLIAKLEKEKTLLNFEISKDKFFSGRIEGGEEVEEIQSLTIKKKKAYHALRTNVESLDEKVREMKGRGFVLDVALSRFQSKGTDAETITAQERGLEKIVADNRKKIEDLQEELEVRLGDIESTTTALNIMQKTFPNHLDVMEGTSEAKAYAEALKADLTPEEHTEAMAFYKNSIREQGEASHANIAALRKPPLVANFSARIQAEYKEIAFLEKQLVRKDVPKDKLNLPKAREAYRKVLRDKREGLAAIREGLCVEQDSISKQDDSIDKVIQQGDIKAKMTSTMEQLKAITEIEFRPLQLDEYIEGNRASITPLREGLLIEIGRGNYNQELVESVESFAKDLQVSIGTPFVRDNAAEYPEYAEMKQELLEQVEGVKGEISSINEEMNRLKSDKKALVNLRDFSDKILGLQQRQDALFPKIDTLYSSLTASQSKKHTIDEKITAAHMAVHRKIRETEAKKLRIAVAEKKTKEAQEKRKILLARGEELKKAFVPRTTVVKINAISTEGDQIRQSFRGQEIEGKFDYKWSTKLSNKTRREVKNTTTQSAIRELQDNTLGVLSKLKTELSLLNDPAREKFTEKEEAIVGLSKEIEATSESFHLERQASDGASPELKRQALAPLIVKLRDSVSLLQKRLEKPSAAKKLLKKGVDPYQEMKKSGLADEEGPYVNNNLVDAKAVNFFKAASELEGKLQALPQDALNKAAVKGRFDTEKGVLKSYITSDDVKTSLEKNLNRFKSLETRLKKLSKNLAAREREIIKAGGQIPPMEAFSPQAELRETGTRVGAETGVETGIGVEVEAGAEVAPEVEAEVEVGAEASASVRTPTNFQRGRSDSVRGIQRQTASPIQTPKQKASPEKKKSRSKKKGKPLSKKERKREAATAAAWAEFMNGPVPETVVRDLSNAARKIEANPEGAMRNAEGVLVNAEGQTAKAKVAAFRKKLVAESMVRKKNWKDQKQKEKDIADLKAAFTGLPRQIRDKFEGLVSKATWAYLKFVDKHNL